MLSRSSVKTAFLSTLKRSGAFALARRRNRRRLRILCYHGSCNEAAFADSLFISRQTFESRLALLRDQNFYVLPLSDAVKRLRERPEELPDNAVVITIDDGWRGTFDYMLPALARYDMHATLYCDTFHLLANRPIPHVAARYIRRGTGQRELPHEFSQSFLQATNLENSFEKRSSAMAEIANMAGIEASAYWPTFTYMTPNELRVFSGAGHSVELHTHFHTMGDFSSETIRNEIEMNRRVLADVLDRDPLSFRHFAYPSGIVRKSAVGQLRALGIDSAVTLYRGTVPPNASHHMLPRILDGEHMTELEFEAELCGLGEILRGVRRRATVSTTAPSADLT